VQNAFVFGDPWRRSSGDPEPIVVVPVVPVPIGGPAIIGIVIVPRTAAQNGVLDSSRCKNAIFNFFSVLPPSVGYT